MKNRYILLIFFSLLMQLTITSCKDKDPQEPPFLTVEKKEVSFSAQAGSMTVDIKTNISDWSASVATEATGWMSVKTAGNKLTIYVSNNENLNIRKGNIQIAAENQKETISVQQLGEEPIITHSPDTLYLPFEATTRNVTLTTNISDIIVEIKPQETDWLTCIKDTENPDNYIITVTANKKYAERVAKVVFKSPDAQHVSLTDTLLVTQRMEEGTVEEINVAKDILIKPTGGKANQAQPGQGIENTFDGVFGGANPYHSPWGNGTRFPVILEYFFDDKPEQIDYLIYYTRSGNGNFGKLKLYVYTEDNPQYTLYGDYNFGEKDAPSRIMFKDGLKKPLKIKFEVLSGAGGFASCDEMQFFRINDNNPIEAKLLNVFTDITCSALKPNVTSDAINALPAFFANIAVKMQNNTYEKDFRIASYQAYSNTEKWAEKLLINPRNVLDNPTGIYAEAGKEILILVGDTHGNELSLRSIRETEYFGDDYLLHKGVNKITPRNTGLLYVMYQVDDITAPSAKPITIHIPMGCGIVNGYWDINLHKTDDKYRELLSKATYDYFDIKGKDIMLKFPTAKFRQHVPNKILPSINFWDEMVQVELSIMGVEDIYPQKMNNRMYARSTKDGYMSAQSYMTNFAENILYKILSPEKMLEHEDNAWGPAHEIGHMHQAAINWIGNTETSNNLFSNLVRHKMTSFPSRGESIEENVKGLLVEKRVFTIEGNKATSDAYAYGKKGYCSMRMQWQLYCYFHWLENDTQFFPKLFKISRKEGHRPRHYTPGWSQLNYVRNACDAAKLDLTDFFRFWGFFRPIELDIWQYTEGHLSVTQQMVDQTIQYIRDKGYPKPKYPIEYIEDREDKNYGDVGKLEQFRQQKPITKAIRYTQNGNSFTIINGDEAIGFEVKEGNQLKFFSNKYQFTVPSEVLTNSCKLFAVQSDGKRILLNK